MFKRKVRGAPAFCGLRIGPLGLEVGGPAFGLEATNKYRGIRTED